MIFIYSNQIVIAFHNASYIFRHILCFCMKDGEIWEKTQFFYSWRVDFWPLPVYDGLKYCQSAAETGILVESKNDTDLNWNANFIDKRCLLFEKPRKHNKRHLWNVTHFLPETAKYWFFLDNHAKYVFYHDCNINKRQTSAKNYRWKRIAWKKSWENKKNKHF